MNSVSVIIPAKNESKYIGYCLQALCGAIQLYNPRSVEVILVDNGSSDTTIDIASSYGCKIVEKPLIKTISKLRNVGVEYSKNEIIAFLDADCIVDKNWINLCVGVLSKNNSIGLVGTPAVPDLSNATWVESCLYRLMAGSVSRPDFVNWIGSSNLFIHKALFIEAGGFDEKLSTAEDVNFCYAVANLNRHIFLEKCINTIHMRESKTILDLFKRELWRGKNSIASLIQNNFSWKEVPSVFIPCANIAAFSLFFISIIFPMLTVLKASFSVVLFIPVFFMIKKQIPLLPLVDLPKYYIISFVYLFARTCSFVLESLFLIKALFKNSYAFFKKS